jgi:hypothetical protein
MARTAKRSRPVASFTHPINVEVHKPRVEVLESARLLDIGKLKRSARAEIEVGYIATRRCRQLVRATVRKGMVTKLVLEPCAEQQRLKITPDIARVLKEARRQVMSKGRRAPGFPMPIEKFMSDIAAAVDETIICVHICIWRYCLDCCFYWYGSDVGGILLCGFGGPIIVRFPR